MPAGRPGLAPAVRLGPAGAAARPRVGDPGRREQRPGGAPRRGRAGARAARPPAGPRCSARRSRGGRLRGRRARGTAAPQVHVVRAQAAHRARAALVRRGLTGHRRHAQWLACGRTGRIGPRRRAARSCGRSRPSRRAPTGCAGRTAATATRTGRERNADIHSARTAGDAPRAGRGVAAAGQRVVAADPVNHGHAPGPPETNRFAAIVYDTWSVSTQAPGGMTLLAAEILRGESRRGRRERGLQAALEANWATAMTRTATMATGVA